MDYSQRLPRFAQKYAKKLAFSKFVARCELDNTADTGTTTTCIRICCSERFQNLKELQQHIAIQHGDDITKHAENIMKHGCEESKLKLLKPRPSNSAEEISCDPGDDTEDLPCSFSSTDLFPWLPLAEPEAQYKESDKEQILLYYKYKFLKNVIHLRSWQEELCKRLHLTGKVRVAMEGINATVGGTAKNTELYIQCMQNHPQFSDMEDWDFKKSEGGSDHFVDGLKVGIYQEIVPMGIDPRAVTFIETGKHLTPEQFHHALESYKKNEHSERDHKIFIDCRNFYESKIGKFEEALCPDIRKFSYWPEYVEQNREFLSNKDVYMYCTGGIRCERGSAYLLAKDICKNVYQLHGGIHKYMEQYPDGYFRGKLFVFDDRYSIKVNDDVLSTCIYCQKPWDSYLPCSSAHCCQLVLSCNTCRTEGLTACCSLCQNAKQETNTAKEECLCTKHRPRIPVETD